MDYMKKIEMREKRDPDPETLIPIPTPRDRDRDRDRDRGHPAGHYSCDCKIACFNMMLYSSPTVFHASNRYDTNIAEEIPEMINTYLYIYNITAIDIAAWKISYTPLLLCNLLVFSF
jgi:hypothetical protein